LNKKNRIKEAFEHGYFDEAKELAKKGAKLWDAATELFPVTARFKFFTMLKKFFLSERLMLL
jgi:hypothetical protein